MFLAISEAILIQRIGHHRRICISYAGNLFPEEAHEALEGHVGNHALLARVLVWQDMHLAHSLMDKVEARLLVRTFQQLGDAVKLFQKPALFAHALLGSGHLSLSLIQRPAKSGVAAIQVAQTPLQVVELAPVAPIGGVETRMYRMQESGWVASGVLRLFRAIGSPLPFLCL